MSAARCSNALSTSDWPDTDIHGSLLASLVPTICSALDAVHYSQNHARSERLSALDLLEDTMKEERIKWCCPSHLQVLSLLSFQKLETVDENLTQNVLCAGCPDDNLCSHGSHTNLHSRVSMLCQLAGQQLIKLGVEDSVCHELHIGCSQYQWCHWSSFGQKVA